MPRIWRSLRLSVALPVGVAAALSAVVVPPLAAQPAPEPRPAPAATGTTGDHRAPAGATVVRLHVGVPDRVFIGQTRDQMLGAFPATETLPFAGQQDAYTARMKEAGLSCVLTGATQETLRVSSIGFNLEGVYEGIAEGDWRTEAGIGRGSTVNDLLAAYGQPAEIVDKGARLRAGTRPDPDAPKLYQYRSEDGGVTTSFVVQRHRVVRIVVNHLEPLERHLLKRPPRAPAPGPEGTAPDPGPPPAPDRPSPAPPPPPAPSPTDPGAPPA